MKSETQALHLAKIMQKHISYAQYELALPFIRVRNSKLKKLRVNDVLRLDMKVLKFILIDGSTVCAELVLQWVEGYYSLVITGLHKKNILLNKSHKYKTVKLSVEKCQMKSLSIGNSLDAAQFELEKIMLISDGQKIAQGTLINVDDMVSMKINEIYR